MLTPGTQGYAPTAAGTTVLPNHMKQGTKEVWNNGWLSLPQQSQSVLRGTKIIKEETDFEGLAKNYYITGLATLTATSTRNPDKIFTDPNNENRQIRMTTYINAEMYDLDKDKAFLQPGFIEKRNEANGAAIERRIDRVVVAALGGDRIIGTPFQADPITATTAAADGTIDMGFQTMSAAFLNELQATLENNAYDGGSVNAADMGVLVSSNEKAELQSDPTLGSSLYSNRKLNNVNGADKPGIDLYHWAGTKTGTITVANPVLPEFPAAGADPAGRNCFAVLPDTVVLAYHASRMGDIERVNGKANSVSLNYVVNIAALVIDGHRVVMFKSSLS